ncbi:MAG: hypothetical protein AAGG44_06705 [Planctomycetota bacterium]
MAERRFSLKTLLVLVTCIALALACFRLVQSNWKLQRDLENARVAHANSDKRSKQRIAQDEKAYWGANGDPLFLYHFNQLNHTSLNRIKNSKHSGVGRTLNIGRDPVLETFSYKLRLLRSLEGTDYYLLTYSVGGKANRKLIEYTGATEVITSSPELVMVLASSKEDAFDALYAQSSSTPIREKIEKWKRGEGSPPATEFTPWYPAAGRP